MPAVTKVELPLSEAGDARLCIALLPRGQESDGTLLDRRRDVDLEAGVPAVQLLENCEFLYQWTGLPVSSAAVITEPQEIFQPDTTDGARGRLRPGLSVGTLNVVLRSSDGERLGTLDLEVRSRKLDYLSEYRWMLRDIAIQMTEIVMDRFAPSEATFVQDETRDAVTLYQRFAFLRALFDSESFQIALGEVVRRPHTGWERREEIVRPGEPTRGNARLAQQLASPGPRDLWIGGVLSSIPRRLLRERTEATHDTTPNRFVKFALERWRSVILDIDRALAVEGDLPAVRRGRQEIGQTLEQLEQVLHRDLFRDLSPLARFPSDDQVLQRSEGYREIFRAYLEFELAAQLSWAHTDTKYQAGQQDIAALYEYWTFLQLASQVAHLVGQKFDLTPLVERRKNGLNVSLRSGIETVLEGETFRLGRALHIALCFSRTFARGSHGSWTRPMRPDFSLIISAGAGESANFEPIVLHFDAKYRVNFIKELFGSEDDAVDSRELESKADLRGGALRSDLLKMHAYRDAVRRSAGAYVLYPGGENEIHNRPFTEYRELLPGLGAFVLRPSKEGDAAGAGALQAFLNEVLNHVATRLTQHERGREWEQEIYGRPTPSATAQITDLYKPGPDTTVLLGYVKSKSHWDWIMERKTYNVRASGRAGGVAPNADLLRSHFLLLYCPSTSAVALTRIVADPEFVTKAAIKATGYPDPRGDYLCVQWRWAFTQSTIQDLQATQVSQLVTGSGADEGTPVVVRWFDLANIPGR